MCFLPLELGVYQFLCGDACRCSLRPVEKVTPCGFPGRGGHNCCLPPTLQTMPGRPLELPNVSRFIQIGTALLVSRAGGHLDHRSTKLMQCSGSRKARGRINVNPVPKGPTLCMSPSRQLRCSSCHVLSVPVLKVAFSKNKGMCFLCRCFRSMARALWLLPL